MEGRLEDILQVQGSLDDTKYGSIDSICPFTTSHSENILFSASRKHEGRSL